MARINRWTGLSELGNTASLFDAGWTTVGRWVPFVTNSNPFRDRDGNGGDWSAGTTVTSLLDEDSGWVTPELPAPIPTFFSKRHFTISVLPQGDAPILKWRNGTTVLGCLAIKPSGQLCIYSGDMATLLATSSLSNEMQINRYYLMEVGITIGDVGSYQVKIDKVDWIPLATGDTKPGADTGVTNLYYVTRKSGNDVTILYDDDVADDAAFCGEGLVTDHPPTGPGATTQLTPSTPPNWDAVNERPPSDSDYSKATSANKEDTYAHQALPAAAQTVKSLVIVARVVRATGEGINTAYLVSRSGGADHEDAGHALGDSYSIITRTLESDPATSAPWTVVNANNSEIGVRFDV